MKNLLLMMSFLSSVQASASNVGKTLLTCNDGGETQVKLKTLPSGELRAALTIESFGGSFVTFPYKNVAANPSRYPVPNLYQSEDGNFKIVFLRTSVQQTKNIASSLTASDLDIHNQALTCSFH